MSPAGRLTAPASVRRSAALPAHLRSPLSVAQARTMTEAQLEAEVARLCVQLKVLRWHHRNSKGTEAGWPDDVIVSPIGRGVLYRELKKETGSVTRAQQQAIDALVSNGQNVGVWRPSDLASGRILREILELSPLRDRLQLAPPAGTARQ